MRTHLAWITAAIVSVVGCSGVVYEVEIALDGDEFQRTVTCYQRGAGTQTPPQLNSDALNRLRAVHGEHEVVHEAGEPIRWVFASRLSAPADDLGGAGTYGYWNSPLGSLTTYIERIEGDDDLRRQIDRRLARADSLADLALAWFDGEFADEPRLAGTREFLDGQFRDDLKNLILLVVAHHAEQPGTTATAERSLARVGQYVIERGYLTLEAIPDHYRATVSGDWRPVLAAVARLLARKSNLDLADAPPRLAEVFQDAAHLRASWDRCVAASPAFERIAGQLNQGGHDPFVDPTALAGELIGRVWLDFFLFNSYPISITVRCPCEPVATNGTWDAADRVVRWSGHLTDTQLLPGLFYVVVAEPDEAAQQRVFGRCVLEGQSLSQFVTWYRALSPPQAQQWDAFIEGLTAQDDPSAAAQQFQFTGPAADPPFSDRLLETGRRLISEL